jgi:hypothetical protein
MATISVNGTDYTDLRFAYFTKPNTGVSALNMITDSLQLGDIQISSYGDKKMEDTYFRRIKNILRNPKCEAMMNLPLNVFQSFQFDKFITLKHKNLQGYFFVEKIDNYKDSKTSVKVYLLYID